MSPGGVFNPTRISVSGLVQFAYDLREFQIVGGPDWILRDGFEVNARAGLGAPRDQVRLMVQSLLEDRFRFVAHTEKRDMRFLALVPARSDGQFGPRIQQLGDDCDMEKAAEVSKRFPPVPVASAWVRAGCADLSAVAVAATRVMQTPVIDRTELTGKWVYELLYDAAPSAAAGIASDPGGAPFVVALQEQLGLKLEPARGPVDVLVIDSVEQPTEN